MVLRTYLPCRKKDYYRLYLRDELNSIAGAIMDLQLRYVVAYWATIS